MSRHLVRTLALAASLSVAAGAPAANAQGSTPYDSSTFRAIAWREVGPFRGGRSVAVAGSASRPQEYWMGTTGGGVFKSTDGGMSWVPMSDKYFGGTIGAIGVSESNPDIVYVGTGEYPIRGNVSHGQGVFKTTDGGKTWTYVGLASTEQISRVRVDPKNPDLVYVGAQGHVYAADSARGVYRTKDGGKTWQKILFRNDSAGVTDIAIDPSNTNVIYAAFWEAWRRPWMLNSGGAGSGIFKSTDGGDHWTEITRNPGLPTGVIGNIGITVSPVKPSRVWAIVEADSGGVYRSDDAGATWTKLNSENDLRQRAWYYSRIFADPKDSNTVYVLNVEMWKSKDGGKTFKTIEPPHGDNHDLWIAPNDPMRMIEGNDGGATVTFTGGKAWTDLDFATAQFYHVVTTSAFPYHICGAQQDNSTLCGPSAKEYGIDLSDWVDAGGGESGYIAVPADSPNVAFAGSYGGYITHKDLVTGIERAVNPWPTNPMGHSAGDTKYRFQWTFPIVTSPHNPRELYAAAQVLFRTFNGGQSWTVISPDLTRHDPRTLGPSGGPITRDQTSVEYYGTIFAVAESPVTKGVIWTGSDDGIISLSRDDGKTWKNVTPKDFGDFTRVSIIEPSHARAGTAYVAANRYQLDDKKPYIWKTTDFGATWTMIANGIPNDQFVRVVREDPERESLLFAGTERGVYVSFDAGAHWQSLQRNLPPVPVHDLAITNGDLVAATHGRSFWIIDDLSPLRQFSPATMTGSAHLFTPRPAYRINWGEPGEGGTHPLGKNPPSGAVVYYWLAKHPKEVKLDFLDANGAVIKSFTSIPDSATLADSLRGDSTKKARTDSLVHTGISADSAKKLEQQSEESGGEGGGRKYPPRPPRVSDNAGLNRFAWNLRYPDATTFRGLIMWAGGVSGPIAPPGTYSVRLTVVDSAGAPVVQTAPFTVLKDPRTHATRADIVEQFALQIKGRDALSRANDAVRRIRNTLEQLSQRDSALSSAPAATRASWTVASEALRGILESVQDSLYQTKNRASEDPLNFPVRLNNEIAALNGVVGSSEARPTAQDYSVFTELSLQLDRELARLNTAERTLLPRVNAVLAQAGQGAVVPSSAEIGKWAKEMKVGGGEDEPLGERDHH